MIQALGEVWKNLGIGLLKYTFNTFLDPGVCYHNLSIIQGSIFSRKRIGKNYHSSSKLPKHPVNNIGMSNVLSFNDNSRALGENMEKGMEATLGIGEFFNKGWWRFCSCIKSTI